MSGAAEAGAVIVDDPMDEFAGQGQGVGEDLELHDHIERGEEEPSQEAEAQQGGNYSQDELLRLLDPTPATEEAPVEGEEPLQEVDEEADAEGEVEEDEGVHLSTAQWENLMQRVDAAAAASMEGEAAAPAEPEQPAAEAAPAQAPVQPLQVPTLPAFEMTEEQADAIGIVNREAFSEFMTERDQAMADHMTNAVLQNMAPTVYAQVAQASIQTKLAQKFFDENPAFNKIPKAVTAATAKALRENPGMEWPDILANVKEDLSFALAVKGNVQKGQGRKIDTRPKRPRHATGSQNATGARPTHPASKRVKELDPSEQAFADITEINAQGGNAINEFTQ